MTYKEFLLKCQQADVTLNESEGTYYFNLWGDTMKQSGKYGLAPGFDAFITWMKIQ